MALLEVKVPEIGAFKDVAVIEIFVKRGDAIKREQSLITVECDKAMMEIPSSAEGVLIELKVKIGDKVNIGDLLVILEGSVAASKPLASSKGAATPIVDSTPTVSQEISYYSIGNTLVSNKRLRFIGFKEESLDKESYEISIENLWFAYKEPPVTGLGMTIIVFLILYGMVFSSFKDAIVQDSSRGFPFTLLIIVLSLNIFIFKINKNSIKKHKFPLKVQSKINNQIIQYAIYLDNSNNILSEIEILLEKINKAKSDYKQLQENLNNAAKLKQDSIQLENLIASFKELIGNNSNHEINIPSVDIFAKSLEDNQLEIAKFDQSWIHDLVKIKSYLKSANSSIKSNYLLTINEQDINYFKKMQAEVVNQIEAYDKVYGNALILIDSIIENNLVLSYEIYEIFDKLGFFESNWEQRLIQKFEDLTDSIEEINININNINEKFDLITNTSISKMTKETDSPNLIQTGMPLLSLYGGYKLGYHMTGPSKNKG
jgi:hypothetical protein